MEKNYTDILHKGAKVTTFKNARNLRRTETKAEQILWQFLRDRRLYARKFRRQHAVANYVLDFYCHECKLAIEVDGGIHDNKMNQQYDEARTIHLNQLGIKVIRFRNEEIINEIEIVLKKIEACLI